MWLPGVQASVGEPLRFHDLRHTHVALLVAAGQHIKVIQERLGHASIRTTLDTYGHLFDGLDQSAAYALNKAFEVKLEGSGNFASAIRPPIAENPRNYGGFSGGR